nr:PhaM family polyhydroxyalkanoate granule multifunctional regulatory protein [Variovorax boronicumulans]
MSDETSGAGFGKFVPGFDFLQSLAKGAAQSMPQMPGLGGWVAPTLNVEDLDKRIAELKAVQFWLDQNAMALKATIQALEVQKMTLATLQGMNVSMAEVAKAFTAQPTEATEVRTPAPPPAARPAPEAAPEPAAAPQAAEAAEGEAARPGVIDAMQWWGALTQQFQQIAATAMQEAAARATPEPPVASAPAGRQAAARKAAAPAKKAAKKAAPRKRAS